MVTAKTTNLWIRLRQAQLLTQGMDAPCSIHTRDVVAIKALEEMTILAGLLSELLTQALEQVEALESPVTLQDEPVADRYTQVRAAVASGTIKPTVRAILEHVGGATLTARRYLMQLETEGVTVRSGRGWEVV